MVLFQMRQLSPRTQIKEKLETIGHHTGFNNEQNPSNIAR